MCVGNTLKFIACISFQRVDNDRSKTFKHGITAAGGRYYNIMNGFPRSGGADASHPSMPTPSKDDRLLNFNTFINILYK